MSALALRRDYRTSQAKYNKKAPQKTLEGSPLFNKKIWRVEDVATFLGCSKGHVYNMVNIEMIPSVKKGKFLYFIPSDILRWLIQGD